MKLNTISKIVLLLMLAFSFSFGGTSKTTYESTDREKEITLIKYVDAAAKAKHDAINMVNSIDSGGISLEQRRLLEQMRNLRDKIIDLGSKTTNMARESRKIESEEKFGSSSSHAIVVGYYPEKIKETGRLSQEVVSTYEEIRELRKKFLNISQRNSTPVSPQPTPIVESINDNIIDVVNVIPEVVVPEVPISVPEVVLPIGD